MRRPEHRAPIRVAQIQHVLRPRDPDIAQPPLLLQLVFVAHAALVREDPLLHPHHEHQRKLQTLGRVQRHQRHLAVQVLGLVNVRDQRDVLQEPPQARILLRLLEPLRKRHELHQVLSLGGVLSGAGGLQGPQVAAVLSDRPAQLGQRQALRLLPQLLHHVIEVRHRVPRPPLHLLIPGDVRQGLVHRAALRLGHAINDAHGLVPDPPSRHVDDPPQGHSVGGVEDRLQIRDEVLDDRALVEPNPAHDLVGHLQAHQRLLKHPRHRVGPVQDRVVAVPRELAVHLGLDRLGDPFRLLLAADRLVLHDVVPGPILRPQLLLPSPLVVSDDLVGALQDLLGRAVVLLQLDDASLWVVLLELQDQPHIRATPAVDALIVIADHADVPALVGKQLHELVLRVVDVLILVHQHVMESFVILLEGLRARLEELHGHHQQVIEIQRIALAQFPLIRAIDALHDLVELAFAPAPILLHPHQLILRRTDGVLDVRRLELLGVDVQKRQRLFDDRPLVALVVDDVVIGHADGLTIGAQDSRADGVEGACPQPARLGADEVSDALFHLPGGFVGEGDGEDLGGGNVQVFDHVGDAVCEGAGLPAPCARDDQNRPVNSLSSLLLLGIEVIK